MYKFIIGLELFLICAITIGLISIGKFMLGIVSMLIAALGTIMMVIKGRYHY